jgi:hypothetical protein
MLFNKKKSFLLPKIYFLKITNKGDFFYLASFMTVERSKRRIEAKVSQTLGI